MSAQTYLLIAGDVNDSRHVVAFVHFPSRPTLIEALCGVPCEVGPPVRALNGQLGDVDCSSCVDEYWQAAS